MTKSKDNGSGWTSEGYRGDGDSGVGSGPRSIKPPPGSSALQQPLDVFHALRALPRLARTLLNYRYPRNTWTEYTLCPRAHGGGCEPGSALPCACQSCPHGEDQADSKVEATDNDNDNDNDSNRSNDHEPGQ